ncbi:MAG: tetratricopeptide repeat protein, partial [Bacteroidetes bacterium]|nr:tetratricopeptide repeat protein [Bacteroidota bacterium]
MTKSQTYHIFLTIILFTFLLPLYAQKNPSKRADQKYEVGEYYKAIKIYERVLKRKKKKLDKPKKAEIAYNMAECYNNINDPKKAATEYKKAIKLNYENPAAVYKFAEMLKMNEQFD